ncbi:hypothetical protein [Arthrobacter sp. M4]|uniref:hypothetical protein n=1 Tax=Arthrobacter sp. M4 TaxID=218160 RepID=UPI001CDB8A70|nr:hypothetical protein [Arthrobacter sp. M4]MCA4135298.1 hypothetical protein [Arthrobacter sp. M4]
MKLTGHIKRAADGSLDLEVSELPELVAHAGSFEGISAVISAAAARLTGLPETDFEIEVRF